jgi:hypothetical protein
MALPQRAFKEHVRDEVQGMRQDTIFRAPAVKLVGTRAASPSRRLKALASPVLIAVFTFMRLATSSAKCD